MTNLFFERTKNAEIELIKKINDIYLDENLVFSPLSIEILLSLCLNGAEGDTQKEILQLLNFENEREANMVSKNIVSLLRQKKEVIKSANLILTQYKAKESFINTGIEKYDTKVEKLNNIQKINEYVRNKTNNKIKKVIDESSLSINDIMTLINILYFKAFWKIQFDPEDNDYQTFYNLNDKSQNIEIMMMNLKEEYFNYYENELFKALKLEYESKADSFHSIIILPEENVDLNDLINQFNDQLYDEIIEGLKGEKMMVEIYIPTFKVEFEVELNRVLKCLGIRKAFTPGDAQFQGISDIEGTYIERVLQKNFISCNEEGTQATSATLSEFVNEKYVLEDPNIKRFVVNRPFLFILRNDECPKGRDILFFTKICKLENEESVGW